MRHGSPYGWVLFLLLAGAGAGDVQAQSVAAEGNSPPPAAPGALEPDYSVNWRRSLMFSESDLSNLRRVLEAYEIKLRSGGFDQQAGQDDYLTEILSAADQENGKSVYKAPRFYLGSIVIYGNGQWVAWIGQEKITSEDNNVEKPLYVEKISKRALVVTWRPGNQWPRIQKFWERRNESTDEPSNYLAGSSRTVTVDEQEQVVHFLLRPNQIFYAGTMEIYEGRIVPAAIEAAFNARFAKLLSAPETSGSALPSKTPMEEGAVPPDVVPAPPASVATPASQPGSTETLPEPVQMAPLP